MNYYQILGVAENASQDEIKKAYKKLAMKNHPDRGGDTQLFQSISQAYDTLSDSQKRQQYDAQKNGFNPFGQQHGPDVGDIFGNFGFSFGPGFAGFNQRRKNKDLSIRVTINFKQSFTGTQIEAKFATPSGKKQTVVVDIPAGVQSGQTIRYTGLGDDSIPSFPKGDLNVTIMVEADPVWERRGNDLYTTLSITVLEAMAGCFKEVTCIDGTKIPITLRAGTQSGAEFACGGRGFRELNTGRTGSLFVIVEVDIPAVTNVNLKQELESLLTRIKLSN